MLFALFAGASVGWVAGFVAGNCSLMLSVAEGFRKIGAGFIATVMLLPMELVRAPLLSELTPPLFELPQVRQLIIVVSLSKTEEAYKNPGSSSS